MKKKHHGMNVQVFADPAGRLIWASDALPGDIKYWADKAYQG
ncbi:hypothetical protein [Streptomyces sp. NPDC127033]